MPEENLYKPLGRQRQGLRIDRRRLYFAGFIILTVLLALVFPFLELKLQAVLIMLPVTLLVVASILINPFNGICLFVLFDYGRLDYFFPFIGPLRVAIILEVVTLLSWIIQLIRTRKPIIWNKFNWLYIGFLAVVGSTVITAWNNRFAYDTFQSMAIYFMIFLIATNVIDSMKKLNRLIGLLFIIHVFFAVKGIAGGGRAGGAFMGDENDFALTMNMMIPFAFFIFLGLKNKIKKFGMLLVLITLTIAVISSLSRGGWVGLIVTIFFCVFKSRKVFTSFAIMLVLTGAIISFAPQKYWSEVETITDTHEETAASRINYWKAALRMFRDYPITGVGASNGGIHMPMYLPGVKNSITEWGRAFHGTLPQVLAELGSLGFIFYILMLITAIKYLNRLTKRKSDTPNDNVWVLSNSIMIGIISYITTATFLSTAYYPQLWTLYTLTMALMAVTNIHSQKAVERPSRFVPMQIGSGAGDSGNVITDGAG